MKKPEYMMNLQLSNPMPIVDESIGFEENMILKYAIRTAENFDDAVYTEIIGIAKEKGFTNILLLNKNDIAEALSKQIPKKITIRKAGFSHLEYICPCCTSRQISQIGGDWIAGQKHKYCSNCGQALDWSDT